MRLLQLNCWGGKLSTAIKRLENQEKPDIVCLQEAYDIGVRPGSVFAAPCELFPADQYPSSHFGTVYSIRYMHELANFGNAIVSKELLPNAKTIFTAGEPLEDMETINGETYNIRNFVHAEARVGGKNVNIITHHGHHDPNSKDGSTENTRQMQIIADYIDTLEGPIILTGDFNLHPKSKSLSPVLERLTDLTQVYQISSTRTELAKRQEVIDYIFVSDDVKVNDFRVSEMIVSDHKALILDFSI